MTRARLMQRFYALERWLSSEKDTARRWRLARLMCRVEAKIAAAHGHRTLAWIANRNPAWYAERGGEMFWIVTRTTVIKKVAA